jgi:hypothetical protein
MVFENPNHEYAMLRIFGMIWVCLSIIYKYLGLIKILGSWGKKHALEMSLPD